MNLYIFSHNPSSEGAKALARALSIPKIKNENSSFVGGAKKTVINWGSRNLSAEILKCTVLNTQEAVAENANKLSFFQAISVFEDSPRLPQFTTDPDQAKSWVLKGHEVVARRTLNGSSGEGIHFMSKDDPDSFVEAPLYTIYVKKKDEFRVHFAFGEIIDFQRKALRAGSSPNAHSWKVRNLANGFVFVRNEVKLPKDVEEQTKLVIKHTSLDFGAIDLIYNEGSAKAYVLEVNTAPGLQGETIESYSNAFKKKDK